MVVVREAPPRFEAVSAPDPPLRVTVPLEERTERYLEIVRIPERRVVTVIELASPTNKVDSRGRAAYLGKQAAVLASDVNLVEIDLIRAGQHWAAVPDSSLRNHGPYDYLVCVSRGTDRTVFECYPRTVREPLPSIAVPLLPADPDVTLKLQPVFARAFDRGGYESDLDYRRPLSPPLRPGDEEWVHVLLSDAGLLGAS